MKSQTKAVVVGSMTAFIGILSPATVFATGNDHDKDRKDSTCYAVEVRVRLMPLTTTTTGRRSSFATSPKTRAASAAKKRPVSSVT